MVSLGQSLESRDKFRCLGRGNEMRFLVPLFLICNHYLRYCPAPFFLRERSTYFSRHVFLSPKKVTGTPLNEADIELFSGPGKVYVREAGLGNVY